MIIDIHTHIFPDKLASAAVDALKKGIINQTGYAPMVYADGTEADMLKKMEDNNIDLSIVMPVVTKPTGSDSINKFARTVRNDRLIPFGGIHPSDNDYERILFSLAQEGFKGIKLHPEFQKYYFDSEEIIAIINKAEEYGLLVLTHAGQDIGLPPPVYSEPERIRNALNYVSGNNLILAHLGGWNRWEDVEKYLVGQNVYFDTAFISAFIDSEQYKRIIKNHGADKILFGSDMPWESPSDTLSALKRLNLTDDELLKITYENAKKLLNL